MTTPGISLDRMAAYQSADDFASTKAVYAQLSTHFFCATRAFHSSEHLVRPPQHPWMCRLSHQCGPALSVCISPTVARSIYRPPGGEWHFALLSQGANFLGLIAYDFSRNCRYLTAWAVCSLLFSMAMTRQKKRKKANFSLALHRCNVYN